MRQILLFLFLIAYSLFGYSQEVKQPYCSHHQHALWKSAQALYPNEENKKSDTINILNYEIHLDVTDFSGKTINGYTKVTFKSRMDNIQQLNLNLLGFTIDSVKSTGLLPYQYNDTLLNIDLPTALNTGDQEEVYVYYHGAPKTDPSGWGGFYFVADYAWNLGVGFQDKPHNVGRYWFPCFDNFVERSTYDFHITTNGNKRAVSNGELVSETTNGSAVTRHWKMSEEIPTYLAMIAVAPYVTIQDQFNSMNGQIPIRLYAKADDTANFSASFVNLKNNLTAFESTYGAYRFNKVGYTLVPFNSGAMEHASNITYPRYAANGSLDDETLMAHELAHHWWGNLATCETPEDMWLNEGMASFSEYVFLEKVYTWERAEERIRQNLFEVLQRAHIDEGGYLAVSGVPHDLTYGTHVYTKGSLVAQNLRHYLGDQAFYDGVTQFLNQHTFSPMNSEMLRDHLSQTTGKDLTAFFDNWVFNGGFPGFEINKATVSGTAPNVQVEIEIGQKLRGATTLYSNVPLDVTFFDFQGNQTIKQIVADGETSTRTVQLNFVPEKMWLNTENRLCYANTSVTKTLHSSGSIAAEDVLFQYLKANAVEDSALIRVEMHWVKPDERKDKTKPYKLSNDRYWLVDGNWTNGTVFEAQFQYTSTAATSFMDTALFNNTEDSLVLLYRATPQDDWEEYQHYTHLIIGSTNKMGFMRIDKLLRGEYTMANIDHSAIGTNTSVVDLIQSKPNFKLHVYPNPTSGNVTIDWNKKAQPVGIEVYALTGTLVDSIQLEKKEKTKTLNTQNWPKGVYFISIFNEQGIRQEAELIVE